MSMNANPNPYIPNLAKILEIREEVKGPRAVKTFKVQFEDEKLRADFIHKPGQCAMITVFGKGECMFAINSPPTRRNYLEFSVLKLGKVTSAIHQMKVGDLLGIRGPYGNNFPIDDWTGKNIVFVGGGIGQAPLRSVYLTMLDTRENYGKIDIIYGARTSNDLVFKQELLELKTRKDVNVQLGIDVPEDGWKYFVGFVPANVLELKPSPENAIAITCGPPIMIKFAIQNLGKLGFKDDQIYTTLENRMKCGIGKCGRCNIGNIYVCKDGPVFTYAQIKNMVQEF